MFENATPDAQLSRIERASYDPDGRESLAVTIADTVARAEGVSPDELDTRVFDVVDPDALDRLFEPADSSTIEAEVSFRMSGYTVVVRNTGDIFVTRMD